jgi:hypothetical protein
VLQQARAYIVNIGFGVLAELQLVLSARPFGGHGYARGQQSDHCQGQEVPHVTLLGAIAVRCLQEIDLLNDVSEKLLNARKSGTECLRIPAFNQGYQGRAVLSLDLPQGVTIFVD